jgi:hypothetical protein
MMSTPAAPAGGGGSAAVSHWRVLQHEMRRRRAAEAAARDAATREAALSLNLADIHEEIATLRREQSRGGEAEPEPQPAPTSYEQLDVAADMGSAGDPGSGSPDVLLLSRSRSRAVSVVVQTADGTDSEAARLTGELATTRSIRPHRSRSVSVQSQLSAAAVAGQEPQPGQQQQEPEDHDEKDSDDDHDDLDDEKYDWHFPQPKLRTRTHTKQEVDLAATKLEADALRRQLDQALGIEGDGGGAASPGAVSEAGDSGGGPLFEAFIIVGGGVDLANEIKAACDWWKPSKAEAEYNELAARTEAEVMCIYPPSTDAGRSSMFQAFALPDFAGDSVSFPLEPLAALPEFPPLEHYVFQVRATHACVQLIRRYRLVIRLSHVFHSSTSQVSALVPIENRETNSGSNRLVYIIVDERREHDESAAAVRRLRADRGGDLHDPHQLRSEAIPRRTAGLLPALSGAALRRTLRDPPRRAPARAPGARTHGGGASASAAPAENHGVLAGAWGQQRLITGRACAHPVAGRARSADGGRNGPVDGDRFRAREHAVPGANQNKTPS